MVRDARRSRAPHHKGLEDLILRRRESAVSKDEAAGLIDALTWTAHGLLLRPVPDRTCQRGIAVSGSVGPVDHFRRDADRQFRPWRVLHARRLCRVHADRAILRRHGILGGRWGPGA